MIVSKIKSAEEIIAKNSFALNLLLSFTAGAIATLTLPPLGLFVLLPVSFTAFILLTKNSQNKKQAFLTGWAFGAGYFIFGLYWISYALFVDIAAWWWVVPLSLIAGPALLGIFYGFIPLISNRYKKHGDLYVIGTCAAFALIEYIRGHIFTGFPWNLSGYSWHHFLPIMQINAYIGIYGLTLATFIWSAIFLIKNNKLQKAIIISFILAVALGTYRIAATNIEYHKDTAIRVVQPNIAQKLKWDPKHKYKNFETLLDITREESDLPLKIVVWPETSTLYRLNEKINLIDVTAASLPEGAIAAIGSMNTEGDYWKPNIYNSVSFISKEKKLFDSYNKHHLVPFGEYIPYREILNLTPVANSIAMVGDFSRGEGLRTIDLGDNIPTPSPLICYEAIFPGRVANNNNRPDWLLNVTNDAWYGISAGPYQHLEIVRVRAIEEGLPLIRAANTGISVIVNPLGIVEEKLGLNIQGKIDTLLPKALKPTLFAKFGNWIFIAMIFVLFSALELTKRRLKK